MLTIAQITALAPDQASEAAARKLLKPSLWSNLGANDKGLWGECQGSSARKYQVLIDHVDMAYKCSCPSRKFPCKHALALLFLQVNSPDKFDSKPPSWFEEWQTKRNSKKQAVKEPNTAVSTDPESSAKQAKRIASRLKKMRKGALELDLWMCDQIRDGIADLPNRPSSFWKEIGARMVDAQAPGLTRRLEDLASLLYTGPDWASKILAGFGRIKLLLMALERYAQLSELQQADILVALGVSQNKEAVANGEQLTDTWVVAGVITEVNAGLTERRVWLLGQRSQRAALILDFAFGGRAFEQIFVTGTCFKATLAFFPSNAPLRAVVSETMGGITAATGLPMTESYTKNLQRATSVMAANPFTWRLPMAFKGLKLVQIGADWGLIDEDNKLLSSQLVESKVWDLAAMSGGHGMAMFGEWQNGHWLPLTAYCHSWLDLVAAKG